MNTILREKVFLVNPNLGHPLFLQIDKDLDTLYFKTNLLFVSNVNSEEQIKKILNYKLVLIPILEYKWKLKQILEKKKKEGEIRKKGVFFKIKRKKGFRDKSEKKKRFKKEKKKRRPSKKHKKSENEKIPSKIRHTADFYSTKLDQTIEEKLKNLKPKAFRGDPIYIEILNVSSTSTISISNLKYIENEYIAPQDYLIKNDVFNGLYNFFVVEIKFKLSDEVIEFLKKRNFVMFDIIVEQKDGSKRINSHSLVISKQDWKDYKIIHATDLHLAERNDRIYSLIKNWLKTVRDLKVDQIALKIKKDSKKIFKKHKKYDDFERKPLKKRLINPNNQFRRFIKIINKKVLTNELDFIVLTGDLVDFTVISRLPKELRKLYSFDFEHSNWKIFKEIVLNLPQKKRRGVIRGEELLCPIFTLPGNHDYRPYHYDIRWGGMYRKIGLRLEEAAALNDKLLAFPPSAITKSNLSLRGYMLEINPSLDYSVKLGNNLFIFLNSGSDSWKNVMDLLSGHPSLTGLTQRQIKYLENLINYKIDKSDNVFLFLHGPPINPKKKRSIFKRIENKFGKEIKTKIDDFREFLTGKIKKPNPKKRIDDKFNIKFGTVSSNWERLITFCKDYCVLTLAGHTHELKEFRLADPKDKTSKFFEAPPFSLKKVENPAAVYYDIYSTFLNDPRDIEKLGPFVVQTPALGLGGFQNPNLVGAYREIIVKNGKLNSFKVHYISK